jgi:hypothetical protein
MTKFISAFGIICAIFLVLFILFLTFCSQKQHQQSHHGIPSINNNKSLSNSNSTNHSRTKPTTPSTFSRWYHMWMPSSMLNNNNNNNSDIEMHPTRRQHQNMPMPTRPTRAKLPHPKTYSPAYIWWRGPPTTFASPPRNAVIAVPAAAAHSMVTHSGLNDNAKPKHLSLSSSISSSFHSYRSFKNPPSRFSWS